MLGYLGDTVVECLDGTQYEGYTPLKWALHYIEVYGGIDGEHHKTWVLDQVARILHDTPVILKLAKWSPNAEHPEGLEEYRFTTGEPTAAYHNWVVEMLGPYDEESECYEYSYNIGIAP